MSVRVEEQDRGEAADPEALGQPAVLPLERFALRLAAGKSSSSRTTCSPAHAAKASVSNTSASSFMHHPHQSLPVKSARIGFPDSRAAAAASS